MRTLFAPWRNAYLSGGRRGRGCIFCKARDAKNDATHLVVHRGRHNFVILNRFPYNSGHLMIVPFAHVGDLSQSTPAQLEEMMVLASRCERALKEAYDMDGVNLGMNLGEAAGAGVLGHFHLHMVPRWKGDTNFMTVVGSTRVMPEVLEESFRKVSAALARSTGAAPTRRRSTARRTP